MDNDIVQYIRKGQKVKKVKDPKTGEKKNIVIYKGKVVGIMVAFIDELDTQKICIGFSRYSSAKEAIYHCKTNTFEYRLKEKFPFDSFYGKNIAKARADQYVHDDEIPKFCKINPNYVHRQFLKFADRVERYFKGATLPEWFSIYRQLHTKGE